jgi:hypothetical protein
MRACTLGELLAEGGAVVGGCAALGATLFFIGASLVHDFRPEVDPDASRAAVVCGAAWPASWSSSTARKMGA